MFGRQKGFTLIELLVVISIIGVLSTIAMTSLNGARVKAKMSKSMTQLQSVNNAILGYYALYGSYPVSNGWQGYCSAWGAGLGVNWIPELTTGGLANGSLPIDPRNNGSCWNDQAQYIYYSNGTDYKLISHQPESMQVPSSLIDPVRPTWAWGWWSPGASSGF
ncbi:MAG: type II secretion system protein [Patescibacteria group bacterium]